MTSQVLYRKWRPRSFAELAGQEHVTTVLRQAVRQGRISHAYLFCGPRGTGKTTSARVLARTLNCLSPQDAEPDNQCAMCRNADLGRALDLIEMDAASNRGIDEIRNLRERVHFAPVEGKYKVYIVDEAHMLTEAASNAFLKTLEEPPPHVIFVLCTTEPHKILPTIISRCQRFDFRRLTTEIMVSRLRFLCEQEGIEADPKALEALARSASGSLRDAENLLEQMVVSYGGKVSLPDVQEALGLTHSQAARELVNYMVMGNTPAALGIIGRASKDGADLRQVHRQSVELLRALMMLQAGAGDTVDLDGDTLKELEALSAKAATGKVVACLKALAEVQLRYDAVASLPLELAIVEAASRAAVEATPPPPAAPPPRRSPAPPPARAAAPPQPRTPPAYDVPARTAPASPVERGSERPSGPPAAAPAPQTYTVASGDQVPVEAWNQVVQTLRRQKGKRFFLGALLKDCKAPYVEDDAMVLPFSYRSNMERMEEELQEVTSRQAIEKALEQFLGVSYKLRLTLRDGGAGGSMSASATSPLVRTARAMGGRVIEEKRLDE